MIGKTISHYKILEKLGQGGMGVVYKAEDTKLDRIVALKFLPKHLLCDEKAKTRFVHEAKAASALDHPNIATIYQIDEVESECFISMAYIKGKSIKELVKEKEFSIEEILKIAIQIAEGLNAAHKKDIIHRDIKSDNIMLTDEGLVKIMDFGLAKLKGATQLTMPGSTLGTVAYMSPEQAQGIEVDPRSDIFSFAAVLYEMITRQMPFRGDHDAAVIYSIVNENPEPLARYKSDVPDELQGIVEKAMEKNPDMRYQHVDDLWADLRKLRKELQSIKERPSAKRSQFSIAVLPFTNLSADPEQEYFCDGMAEEIINALTHVESLRVVARTSALSFRDKEIDIREIGRKLRVDKVLEGSVRKAGNRLRISAQLVNVADGYHLWSERYDRDLEDVFAIQDEISLAIVDELKVKLLGGEKAALAKRYTSNLEAYTLYLKGRHFWNQWTEEGWRTAFDYFQQAIEKDRLYALAYTGIADCYNALGMWNFVPPKEAFPKAKAAAKKALEMDDMLAEAHAALAFGMMVYNWNWKSAEREIERCLELSPNYAIGHLYYGNYLTIMGQLNEAMEEFKRALELDPLSPIINAQIGQTFFWARQYDQATEELQRLVTMELDLPLARLFLAEAYMIKGMYDKAVAEYKNWLVIFGLSDEVVSAIEHAYEKSGLDGAIKKIINVFAEESKEKLWLAHFYCLLGENERAFDWLEKAYEARDPKLPYIKLDPIYDNLRSDLRFTVFLKKMGLEK